MRQLRFLAAAQRDLQQIARYIRRESGSRRTAGRFVGGLVDRCRNLASIPGVLGSARPELGAEIRSFTHRGYLIFFRYRGRDVEIVRVMEGHRDLEAGFTGDLHAQDRPALPPPPISPASPNIIPRAASSAHHHRAFPASSSAFSRIIVASSGLPTRPPGAASRPPRLNAP